MAQIPIGGLNPSRLNSVLEDIKSINNISIIYNSLAGSSKQSKYAQIPAELMGNFFKKVISSKMQTPKQFLEKSLANSKRIDTRLNMSRSRLLEGINKILSGEVGYIASYDTEFVTNINEYGQEEILDVYEKAFRLYKNNAGVTDYTKPIKEVFVAEGISDKTANVLMKQIEQYESTGSYMGNKFNLEMMARIGSGEYRYELVNGMWQRVHHKSVVTEMTADNMRKGVQKELEMRKIKTDSEEYRESLSFFNAILKSGQYDGEAVALAGHNIIPADNRALFQIGDINLNTINSNVVVVDTLDIGRIAQDKVGIGGIYDILGLKRKVGASALAMESFAEGEYLHSALSDAAMPAKTFLNRKMLELVASSKGELESGTARNLIANTFNEADSFLLYSLSNIGNRKGQFSFVSDFTGRIKSKDITVFKDEFENDNTIVPGLKKGVIYSLDGTAKIKDIYSKDEISEIKNIYPWLSEDSVIVSLTPFTNNPKMQKLAYTHYMVFADEMTAEAAMTNQFALLAAGKNGQYEFIEDTVKRFSEGAQDAPTRVLQKKLIDQSNTRLFRDPAERSARNITPNKMRMFAQLKRGGIDRRKLMEQSIEVAEKTKRGEVVTGDIANALVNFSYGDSYVRNMMFAYNEYDAYYPLFEEFEKLYPFEKYSSNGYYTQEAKVAFAAAKDYYEKAALEAGAYKSRNIIPNQEQYANEWWIDVTDISKKYNADELISVSEAAAEIIGEGNKKYVVVDYSNPYSLLKQAEALYGKDLIKDSTLVPKKQKEYLMKLVDDLSGQPGYGFLDKKKIKQYYDKEPDEFASAIIKLFQKNRGADIGKAPIRKTYSIDTTSLLAANKSVIAEALSYGQNIAKNIVDISKPGFDGSLDSIIDDIFGGVTFSDYEKILQRVYGTSELNASVIKAQKVAYNVLRSETTEFIKNMIIGITNSGGTVFHEKGRLVARFGTSNEIDILKGISFDFNNGIPVFKTGRRSSIVRFVLNPDAFSMQPNGASPLMTNMSYAYSKAGKGYIGEQKSLRELYLNVANKLARVRKEANRSSAATTFAPSELAKANFVEIENLPMLFGYILNSSGGLNVQENIKQELKKTMLRFTDDTDLISKTLKRLTSGQPGTLSAYSIEQQDLLYYITGVIMKYAPKDNPEWEVIRQLNYYMKDSEALNDAELRMEKNAYGIPMANLATIQTGDLSRYRNFGRPAVYSAMSGSAFAEKDLKKLGFIPQTVLQSDGTMLSGENEIVGKYHRTFSTGVLNIDPISYQKLIRERASELIDGKDKIKIGKKGYSAKDVEALISILLNQVAYEDSALASHRLLRLYQGSEGHVVMDNMKNDLETIKSIFNIDNEADNPDMFKVTLTKRGKVRFSVPPLSKSGVRRGDVIYSDKGYAGMSADAISKYDGSLYAAWRSAENIRASEEDIANFINKEYESDKAFRAEIDDAIQSGDVARKDKIIESRLKEKGYKLNIEVVDNNVSTIKSFLGGEEKNVGGIINVPAGTTEDANRVLRKLEKIDRNKYGHLRGKALDKGDFRLLEEAVQSGDIKVADLNVLKKESELASMLLYDEILKPLSEQLGVDINIVANTNAIGHTSAQAVADWTLGTIAQQAKNAGIDFDPSKFILEDEGYAIDVDALNRFAKDNGLQGVIVSTDDIAYGAAVSSMSIQMTDFGGGWGEGTFKLTGAEKRIMRSQIFTSERKSTVQSVLENAENQYAKLLKRVMGKKQDGSPVLSGYLAALDDITKKQSLQMRKWIQNGFVAIRFVDDLRKNGSYSAKKIAKAEDFMQYIPVRGEFGAYTVKDPNHWLNKKGVVIADLGQKFGKDRYFALPSGNVAAGFNGGTSYSLEEYYEKANLIRQMLGEYYELEAKGQYLNGEIPDDIDKELKSKRDAIIAATKDLEGEIRKYVTAKESLLKTADTVVLEGAYQGKAQPILEDIFASGDFLRGFVGEYLGKAKNSAVSKAIVAGKKLDALISEGQMVDAVWVGEDFFKRAFLENKKVLSFYKKNVGDTKGPLNTDDDIRRALIEELETRGVVGLLNRPPTNYTSSVKPVKIFLDRSISGGQIKTFGHTALSMFGDFDGDLNRFIMIGSQSSIKAKNTLEKVAKEQILYWVATQQGGIKELNEGVRNIAEAEIGIIANTKGNAFMAKFVQADIIEQYEEAKAAASMIIDNFTKDGKILPSYNTMMSIDKQSRETIDEIIKKFANKHGLELTDEGRIIEENMLFEILSEENDNTKKIVTEAYALQNIYDTWIKDIYVSRAKGKIGRTNYEFKAIREMLDMVSYENADVENKIRTTILEIAGGLEQIPISAKNIKDINIHSISNIHSAIQKAFNKDKSQLVDLIISNKNSLKKPLANYARAMAESGDKIIGSYVEEFMEGSIGTSEFIDKVSRIAAERFANAVEQLGPVNKRIAQYLQVGTISGIKEGQFEALYKNIPEGSTLSAALDHAEILKEDYKMFDIDSDEIRGEVSELLSSIASGSKIRKTVEESAQMLSKTSGLGGMQSLALGAVGMAATLMIAGFVGGNPAPAETHAQETAEDTENNEDYYNVPSFRDNGTYASKPKNGYVININASTKRGTKHAIDAINSAIRGTTNTNVNVSFNINEDYGNIDNRMIDQWLAGAIR